IEQARFERARWLRVAGVLAAAAVVAMAVGTWQFWRPGEASGGSLAMAPQSPSTSSTSSSVTYRGGLKLIDGSVEGHSPEISADSHFAPDSRVRTKLGGRAVFVADAGYRVELAESTEVEFPPQAGDPRDTVLLLGTGSVSVAVAPREPGHHLEVRTADARVRVKGTRFTVQLWGDIPRTCVRVEEGLVEVERAGGTSLLAAGKSEGCPPAEAAPASLQHAAAGRSTLDEETRLLTAALAAEKGGQGARAQRLYADFLSRYPKSRFAPEARAGQARLRSGGE
ncbi:MAG TPA: FecR family protein, partial [Polyangiaceae bacterium]|nr:FecR family protein [Polyangiaceae bacterium]